VPDRSFVIVAVIGFLAPVLREMLPQAFVPAIVFELVGGMIVVAGSPPCVTKLI
jgi:hypothetical protein